jgi:Na+-translocating ferredoxin:NAD+ oxidoreductase RnfD subunit
VSHPSALRRFLKTPKGILILLLAVLAAIAAPGEGLAIVAPGFVSAVLAAAAIDAVVLRARRGRWTLPDGGVLSGMFVAMVLSAQGPWHYAPVTAAVAVLSKYVVRSRAGNVFNPAALAIVLTFYVFNSGQSWWGALPNVPLVLQPALVGIGLYITDRVNRMPLVLVFLGCYFALFTAAAFIGPPGPVAAIFRPPDLHAVLFFAFFILTDPPTSPVTYRDQLVCGAIVAASSFAVFEWLGAVHYLLAGVLVGNVWEAWRRVRRRAAHPFPSGIGEFLIEISPLRTRNSHSRQSIANSQ